MLTEGGTIGTTKPMHGFNLVGNETVTITDITLGGCLSSNTVGTPSSGSIPDMTFSVPPVYATNVGAIKEYDQSDCANFPGGKAFLKVLGKQGITAHWLGQPALWGGLGFTIVKPLGGVAASNGGSELGFTLPGRASGGVLGGDYADSATAIAGFVSNVGDGANLNAQCSGDTTVTSVTLDATTSTAQL